MNISSLTARNKTEKILKKINEILGRFFPMSDYEKERFDKIDDTARCIILDFLILLPIMTIIGPVLTAFSLSFWWLTPYAILIIGFIVKLILHNSIVFILGCVSSIAFHVLFSIIYSAGCLSDIKDAITRKHMSVDELKKENTFKALEEHYSIFSKEVKDKYDEEKAHLILVGNVYLEFFIREMTEKDFVYADSVFHKVMSSEEAKKQYRDLLKQYHPDNKKNHHLSEEDCNMQITKIKKDYERIKAFYEYIEKEDRVYCDLIDECKKYFIY